MLVVLSIVHLAGGQDNMFLHGVFQDEIDARETAQEVKHDRNYILNEGYDMEEVVGVTVHVSVIPMGIRVDEYIAKDV